MTAAFRYVRIYMYIYILVCVSGLICPTQSHFKHPPDRCLQRPRLAYFAYWKRKDRRLPAHTPEELNFNWKLKRMSDVCIYIYMYMLYIYTHMIVHIQYYMFSLSFSLHIIRICMNMTCDVAVSSVRPSPISNKLRTDVHNRL